ncbi:MFS transporter [Dictyobacter aurantiacus]|uniref:MFS transporter n=1 Tax=Dictyobacter aurantiacus TaxID=1936993 RepID=A0A401ZP33_9CHLR|nr:MFS transporter [Dictyobacter aurantiacus]GCE08637.1 MFS transporter [Dictyobacter aurantiacus]
MNISTRKRIHIFQALRSRRFLFFWLGQTISAMGNDAFAIALAWEVLIITGSAEQMALVRIIEELPRIIFLLLGGVAADRLPKQRVILLSDCGRGLLVVLITVLAWLHLLLLWHVVVVALIFGMVRGFFGPAYRSLLPQLVESKELLPSVNAMNGLSKQGSQLIGPSLGATLFAAFGPISAFLFDALTFIFSAICTLIMGPARPRQPMEKERPLDTPTPKKPLFQHVGSEIIDGLRYVCSVPWIWLSIVLVSLAGASLAGLDQVALPKLLQESQLHLNGILIFGGVGSAMALGALLSTLVIGQFPFRRRGIVAYSGLILVGLAFLLFALPLFSLWTAFIFLGAGVLVGLGEGLFEIMWDMQLQTHVAEEKLGRVYSVYLLGINGLVPLGLWQAGFISDHFGAAWAFIGGGILSIILALIGLSQRSIRYS